MKKQIDIFEHSTEIVKALKEGVLLTTKSGNRVNTMTISWGTLGIQWGKPLFTAFVRQHRFTKEFLDETGEFTVNMPMGEYDKKILAVCGSKSAPGIRELPLTLECKVRYIQDQDLSLLDTEDVEAWYPADENGFRDFHTVYAAEIVAAYIIE